MSPSLRRFRGTAGYPRHMPSGRSQKATDAAYLDRGRREALRRDYRLLTPGQRVEQAAMLSAEMTKLAARRTERA